MHEKKTINDLISLGVKNKRVLVRVDFNVPLDTKGEISDDTRIRASLPSIQKLLKAGAAVILISHMGRPKGKWVDSLTLAPCAKRLEELLNLPVKFDCIGPEVEEMARQLQPGEVLMLENLRFYPAEEHPSQDPHFAQQLASLADFFVNDAFATTHRAHSSTVEIVQYFPHATAVGDLVEKEIHYLGSMLKDPKHPFVAIIGGAKISTKIEVLKALVTKIDFLLIGGAMAWTFWKALGHEIGQSLFEAEYLKAAEEILKLYESHNIPLYLPVDALATSSLESDEPTYHCYTQNEGIPPGMIGADIGRETESSFADVIKRAKTIFWNGPMGIFEKPPFDGGTFEIAKAIADSSALSVVGGGDSVAALNALGLADKMTHISTGGGAVLEWIEQGNLPGIRVIDDALTGAFHH